MFSLSGSSLRKNLARILLSVFVCNIFSPLQFAFATVTWNVVYSTTAPTNQNVIATLNTSELVTFDMGTSSPYSFSQNGSTTLYFHDADNNDYSVDIEVTNIDKVAPVVTLIGSGTMTISQGQSFVDPGATWSDTKIVKFGSGTRESPTGNDIITTPTTGSVDINTPGTYTLTYNKTDDAGNPGAAVTRTVTITPAPDTTPPVLTLVGNESITVLKGSTYTDSGALWTDNVDGTGVVISVDTVDTNIVGVYTLGYKHMDLSGNPAISIFRTVTVTLAPDTTPPVITLSGSATMNIYVGSGFTDPGATCTDDRDVSCTVTVTGSVDTSQTGTYMLEYSAKDTANNSATGVTRTVNVISHPTISNPIITLTGAQIATGSVNISSGTTVASGTLIDLAEFPIVVTGSGGSLSVSGSTDIVVASGNWDGTLTSSIAVTGALALQASEVANIVGLPQTNTGIIYTNTTVGTMQVGASGAVLTASGGVFQVNYIVTDPAVSSGSTVTIVTSSDGTNWTQNTPTATCVLDANKTCSFTTDHLGLFGFVATTSTPVPPTPDTTPPVVILSGATIISIPQGSVYTDAGASWTDNRDGSGSTLDASFTLSGTVSTLFLGAIYTLTYTKVDAAGNSHSASRTIFVTDQTPPTATVAYSTTSPTNQSVIATLTGASEVITVTSTGGATHTFTTNGSFVFTFTDASGNTGSATATVANIDTIAPVITLSGAIIAYATQGLPYTDAGASWTDDRDGSGSALDASFTLTGIVDTTTLGAYTIDYNKRDAAGNIATAVSRVVVVRAPANIVLTGSLINTGSVNIPTSGNTGLIASGTLVVVNNNTVSTSTSSGTLSISGNTVITPTSTWDGQIFAPSPTTGTGLLELSENGVLPNLPSSTVSTGVTNTALMTIQVGSTGTSLVASGGTFTISYIVNTPTASSGSRIYVFRSNDGSNWTSNTPDSTCILDATLACTFRTDHLSYFGFVSSLSTSLIDTTAPIVTLSGASSITIAQNSIYTDSGASWVDDFDGSGSVLTGSLGQTGSFTQTIKDASGTILGSIDTALLGTYTISYIKVDQASNTSSLTGAVRTITVTDQTPPTAQVIYSTTGATNQSVVATLTGASETITITNSTGVTTTASGQIIHTFTQNGTFTFEFKDASNNTGSVTAIVTNIDTVASVITLNGSGTITVAQVATGTYTDLGASWTDNTDGSGSTLDTTFTRSGTVDLTTLGTYTLTYNKIDAVGNTATPVTRTVIVTDQTPPTAQVIYSTTGATNQSVVATLTGASETITITNSTGVTTTASGQIIHTFTQNGTFTFEFKDASNNTGSVTAIVTNIDTVAPVITLNGSGTITVAQVATGTYTDLGASWTDNTDGSGSTLDTTFTRSGTVDLTTLGTYTLTYNKIDAVGNTATPVTRTVIVTDQTPPTASVVYNNSGSLTTTTTSTGLTVTNQSVTATLTGASETITITNSTGVTTTASGNIIYTFTTNGSFTFTFVDASGNTGSTTATVTNIDTVAPVITLNGSGTLTIPQTSTQTYSTTTTDSGALFTEVNHSGTTSTGTLTASSGSVDTTTLGTYTLTFTYTDAAGNVATPVTRTVIVTDQTPPTAQVIYSTTGATNQDVIATLTGASESITVTSTGGTTHTFTQNGSFTFIFQDASGNTGSVTATATNIDKQAPVITLVGSGTITVAQVATGTYTDLGATWTDNTDGSGSVTASGSVDLTTLGTYTLTYDKVDSVGNPATQVTRTVIVTDQTPPTITLTVPSTITITQGTVFIDPGANCLDNIDMVCTVTISGSVNTAQTGSYILTYRASDIAGNVATMQTRTIIVVAAPDITAPVITLSGSSVITLTQGTSYVDAGAVWTDNIDGTGNLIASGTVNTAIPGIYILSYGKTDTAGNVAIPVIRTITVVTNTVPAISGGNGGGGGGGGSSSSIAWIMPTNSSFIASGVIIPVTSTILSTSKIFPDFRTVCKKEVIDLRDIRLQNFAKKLNVSAGNMDRSMTRGEFVQLLINTAQIDISKLSPRSAFPDVRVDSRYALAIQYAVGAGIISGYADGQFRPNAVITRAEAAKILIRTTRLTLTPQVSAFRDVADTETGKYIQTAYDNCILSGRTPQLFQPESPLTKAETLKILYNIQL